MYHPIKVPGCMRGEHSHSEREVCIPWRARLAEEKSAGFSPPSLLVLFLALGGENSPVCRLHGATAVKQ
eukprot:719010-Pleurochrysis_carterae.AAC.2